MKLNRIKFLTATIEVPDNYPLLVNNKGIMASEIVVGDFADMFGDVLAIEKGLSVSILNEIDQQRERVERLKRKNRTLTWLLVIMPFVILLLTSFIRLGSSQ